MRALSAPGEKFHNPLHFRYMIPTFVASTNALGNRQGGFNRRRPLNRFVLAGYDFFVAKKPDSVIVFPMGLEPEDTYIAQLSGDDSLFDATNELLLVDNRPEESFRRERRRKRQARDSVQRRCLAVGDAAGVLAATSLADRLIVPNSLAWWNYLVVLTVIPLAKLAGMYDRDSDLLHKTTLDELPHLAALAFAVSAVVFALHDLGVDRDGYLGTANLIVFWLAISAFLAAMRGVARAFARRVNPLERLLVIGSEFDMERLRDRVERGPAIDAQVIGRVPIAYDELPYGPSKMLGRPRELERIISRHEVDRVVIMPGTRHSDEVADVIRAVRSVGVKLSVLPSAIDAIGAVTRTDDIAGLQLLAICDAEFTASSRFLKRAMDICGGASALLILSPMLLLIALAVRLDSRGPVFFRQQRVGRDGRHFGIIKFRSMRDGADAEKDDLQHLNLTPGLFKIENDPRITRVGELLRRTSLDELPQLFNVIRGDMSLVGPRPLIPEEDSAITGWYRRRSHITPGITGIWQLLGAVRIPLDEMVKLDYLYVANWSIWSDLKILLRTVAHVFHRRGL